MAILPVGIGPQEGGYQIERSLRFNSADSAYLNRTPGSAGNRQKFTIAGWLKLGRAVENGQTDYGNVINAYASGDDNGYTVLEFHQNTLRFRGWNTTWRQTTQVFRDASAWYFVLVSVDTTQATAANRIKMYLNGAEITAFSTNNNPSQNANLAFNSTGVHRIGQDNAASSSRKYDGYMAEFYLIDGQALDPTSFGEYNTDTGVWQPKAYTGSYGTNGFYLDFSDNSGTTSTTLGKDYSGNGNNWTPNNFSVTAGAGNDSLVDTPTSYGTDTGVGGEVRGNYATLNPVLSVAGHTTTFSDGNLKVTSSGAVNCFGASTIQVSSGKWYFEAVSAVTGATVGAWKITSATTTFYINPNENYRYYSGDGKVYNGTSSGGGVSQTYSTWTIGDVIGVALDMDNGKVYFSKNGTWQGSSDPATQTNPAATGLTGDWGFGVNAGATSGDNITANFGQRPFAYTAPSGFKALCTQNLPEPTVVDGGDYFNAVLYTGNGSTQSITGVGFQPDLVWAKCRSNSYHHKLVDAVRGATLTLSSSQTAAEQTETNSLTAFNSDGFSLGSISSMNASAETFVAWNWKAGGTGVSNTAGTITSTVSANTTAGFSIVTWTGTGVASDTVGHGLGVQPAMVIAKARSGTYATNDWWTNHKGDPTAWFQLNSTISRLTSGGTNGAICGQSSTTSTTFTFTNGSSSVNNANGSGTTYVAYCFAPVEGYSAFGSYTGNGSTDGSFIYTGFRPRYVLMKSSTQTSPWQVFDTARDPTNVCGYVLLPNSSAAESSFFATVDILSNGFKLRYNGDPNTSGQTYIYAAFAENPFKYSLAR